MTQLNLRTHWHMTISRTYKMIKKCDHFGCTKAGTCRAPKTRDLKEYWWFCKEHAAEYNKNWNYYANMSPDEINDEWERETFGIADTICDGTDFFAGILSKVSRPDKKSFKN